MDDRRRGGGREVVFTAGVTLTSQETTTCKTSRRTTGVAAGSGTAKTIGKAHEILFLKVHFILTHLPGFLSV
jgi:hypothetical protein